MNIINNNPYRIAGILSNATTKELEKQKGKIKAYTKVGKEIKSDFDFQILGSIDRTEDSVNKAFSNIEQNQDKVNYALFWFMDDLGLQHLKAGNDEKALEIWEKVTTDKDVNSKNFSAFNNLGTYKLLSTDKSDIKTGIEAKIKLIKSDYFESFVHSVADETYTIDNQKQSEKLIDELLTQFKNQYSSSETLQLFSGCNGTTQKYLSQKFTEEPIHKIESQIESCKKKRKADKGNAYEFGLRLFTNTKDDLSLLKSLLGTSDLKYKAVSDQLANEIMQCGIDYFMECRDYKNPSQDTLKLLKFAETTAISKLIKEKANDSINSVNEWTETAPIKEDLDFITNKLKSFQNLDNSISNVKSLVNSCNIRLQNIKNILGSQDEFYLNISSAIVSNALGMLIAVVNQEQDAFSNQLAFYRSIEGLKKTISDAVNATRIIEHLDMNNQARDHFNKNKQALLNIEKQIFNATASSAEKAGRLAGKAAVTTARAGKAASKAAGTFVSEMREKNKTEGGCYIATMAYGDYDHPQVLELRKFRDDILSKTILGRSFIKFYYKYSPFMVEKLKTKKGINFLIRAILDLMITSLK